MLPYSVFRIVNVRLIRKQFCGAFRDCLFTTKLIFEFFDKRFEASILQHGHRQGSLLLIRKLLNLSKQCPQHSVTFLVWT